MVEVVPGQAGLGQHGGGDQRGDGAAEGVARLEEALHLVGACHVAGPRAPRCVDETVAHADENEGDDEDGVGRVEREGDVGKEVAEAGDDGHAALPIVHVDGIVDE